MWTLPAWQPCPELGGRVSWAPSRAGGRPAPLSTQSPSPLCQWALLTPGLPRGQGPARVREHRPASSPGLAPPLSVSQCLRLSSPPPPPTLWPGPHFSESKLPALLQASTKPGPPKPSSSATLVSAIPPFIPVSLGVKEHRGKAGPETKQDPLGPSWVQKPLGSCLSCFLFVEKGFGL